MRIWDKIVQHQCGFLGCRVGEASNVGPAIIRQSRRLERPTQIDVSSDEDFLVWPNWGRHVIARRCVDNEETPPCSTVPAGSQELLEANLSHVPPSLLDDLERDLSEVQPTVVDGRGRFRPISTSANFVWPLSLTISNVNKKEKKEKK